jgi:hypothetical protein
MHTGSTISADVFVVEIYNAGFNICSAPDGRRTKLPYIQSLSARPIVRYLKWLHNEVGLGYWVRARCCPDAALQAIASAMTQSSCWPDGAV